MSKRKNLDPWGGGVRRASANVDLPMVFLHISFRLFSVSQLSWEPKIGVDFKGFVEKVIATSTLQLHFV